VVEVAVVAVAAVVATVWNRTKTMQTIVVRAARSQTPRMHGGSRLHQSLARLPVMTTLLPVPMTTPTLPQTMPVMD
jgi:hypothetical protein